MNDLRLIVWLVRVDRQQVEISREDLLRRFEQAGGEANDRMILS